MNGEQFDASQLATSAINFKSVDRQFMNMRFADAPSRENLLGDTSEILGAYSKHLLVGEMSEDSIIKIRERPEILRNLNENVREMAVLLYKVLADEIIHTEMKLESTELFVCKLLSDLGFDKDPFSMKRQSECSFNVHTTRVSATPDLIIERDSAALFLILNSQTREEMRLDNEFGECRIAAELIACAYGNFSRADSPRCGKEQIIYAMRVLGSRFMFYKASFSLEYLQSLGEGPPTNKSVEVLQFPHGNNPDIVLGFDYMKPYHRSQILNLMSRLRNKLTRI